MNILKSISRLPKGKYVFCDQYGSLTTCSVSEDLAMFYKYGTHPLQGSWFLHLGDKLSLSTDINGFSIKEKDPYISDDKIFFVSKLENFKPSIVQRIKRNVVINCPLYLKVNIRKGYFSMKKLSKTFNVQVL